MARRTQQQELVSLFAADGMTLDPALIPTDTAVSTYALIRDEYRTFVKKNTPSK